MRKVQSFAWIGFLVLTVVPQAFAQGVMKDFPAGKWWTDQRVINQLSLTLDQRMKIEAVWTQNRRILIDQKAELEKRQLDLEELVAKDSIDEAVALKAFDRAQEARGNLERNTFLMRIQIKNLLTPEQQQKLEAIAGFLRQQKGKSEDPQAAKPAAKAIKKSDL